ncbi:ATP-binding cassette domain-containing protein, partial [Cronobacter sakazakii]|nr:ATP-binding cassette domain-containing protein [Cronobacter sakazakii]
LSKRYLKSIYDTSDANSGKNNSGEMSQALNQATNDVYILINAFTSSLFPPVIQLVVAIIFIINSGDILVAGVFTVFAVSYSALNIFFSKRLALARNTLMESGRKTYGLLVDSVQNVPVVRSFNTFDYFFTRFRETLLSDLKTQRAYWRLNFVNLSLGGLLQLCFFGISFFYTLHNVLTGVSPLSHFILISSYLLVISAPLENLGQAYIDFVQSGNSLKLFIDRNRLNEEKSGNQASLCVGKIENVILKDLVYCYPNSGFRLGPVSLSFEKGSFTSVSGFNGSGKSTLMKILTRQYRPASGEYLLSGVDVNKISTASFCEKMAYVSQDDFIFRDSVEFNLHIANPEATREQMLAAVRKAGFSPDDCSDSEILSRQLSDAGVNLSGGQRQKLSLARLFLRNPELILLDEITSSLDMQAERQLLLEVRNSFPSATIISISHRPAAFAISDSVIIFENGQVSEHTSPQHCRYLRTHFADGRGATMSQ